MTNLQVAADSLGQLLFKARWSKDGSVGLKPASLVVYVNGAQASWKGLTPQTWQGFKVEWHFGMGAVMMLGIKS
jgi:hypothetical protein